MRAAAESRSGWDKRNHESSNDARTEVVRAPASQMTTIQSCCKESGELGLSANQARGLRRRSNIQWSHPVVSAAKVLLPPGACQHFADDPVPRSKGLHADRNRCEPEVITDPAPCGNGRMVSRRDGRDRLLDICGKLAAPERGPGAKQHSPFDQIQFPHAVGQGTSRKWKWNGMDNDWKRTRMEWKTRPPERSDQRTRRVLPATVTAGRRFCRKDRPSAISSRLAFPAGRPVTIPSWPEQLAFEQLWGIDGNPPPGRAHAQLL